MNKTMKFFASEKDKGKRLDIFLSDNIKHLTRSNIKKIINLSLVKVNKKISKFPSKKVKNYDLIELKIESEPTNKLVAKKMKLNIYFEDNDIIVVDKPKGLVVHPGAGNYEDTLVNGLVYKYRDKLSNISGNLRPGIVHRLDKETSGLLVIAKNNLSHSKLSKQFSDHSVKREYLCLAFGVVRPLKGKIETLISRSKINRQLMSVSEIRGKKAITNYETIKVFMSSHIPKISLIKCKLETGRTHQIRVHMKYKGVSLLGDAQYGNKKMKFKKIDLNFLNKLSSIRGQALHAKSLEFMHPTKNKWVKFESELPEDFQNMLNLLKKLSS